MDESLLKRIGGEQSFTGVQFDSLPRKILAEMNPRIDRSQRFEVYLSTFDSHILIIVFPTKKPSTLHF